MLRNERNSEQVRNLEIQMNANMYAEGSCLVKLGNTQVLVTSSIENKVPSHLKGTSKGWVTAEYSMLPRATQNRSTREGRRKNLEGRTQEIQRLIGRSIRAVTKLENLGPRTIWIDCDVLQADGGTRIASILGGFIAFYETCLMLLKKKQITENPVQDILGAVSIGMIEGEYFVDLEYREDLIADVDMNIVGTKSGKIIEVQGTAEGLPFDRDDLIGMLDIAMKGIQQFIRKEEECIALLNQKYNT